MGQGKQAKTLNRSQIKMVAEFLGSHRNGLRNQTIFLLSVKSGLRAKEISRLKWAMVLKSDGTLDDYINLPNSSSKGKSGGRTIPLNRDVKENLKKLLLDHQGVRGFDHSKWFIVQTERSHSTSAQSIVNMFQRWYGTLGLVGCSSHSGRRTFITETAKKISTVGGSLRDVQMMVGHSSLQTTQRYIDADSEAQRKVVDLI
ncbi:site-specific integrase [Amylibacter sp.]|nr:site-specific integrase [Amylibacter sp.]